MPDIRLVRRRGSQVWIWTGLLAAVGLLIWGSAIFFGDPTERQPRVGAGVDFGERAPVLPLESEPFTSLVPLAPRDLGRLVRLSGTVESRVVRGNLWVRADDGRRILVRVEPLPTDMVISLAPGRRLEVEGYLENISRAEFTAWMDSLGVRVPRPPPAPRFGQQPDPAYARIDALFIKNYYISVRPEQLRRALETPGSA